MDIISASKGSNWFKSLDNSTVNPVGGNNVNDGVNGPKFGPIVDELNKAKTVAEQIQIWQKYLKDPTILTGKGLDAAKKAFNTWMVDGKLPTNVQAVLSKDPLATLPALPLAQLNYNKDDPASVTAYADALKTTYKDVKDADGTPVFTPEYLDSVAKGTISQATFDTKINDLAIAAATKDLKAQGISLDDVGGIAGLTKSGGLADYLNDPNKISSSLSSSSVADSIKLKDKATKTEEGIAALENYDPNAGTWDPTVDSRTMPFGDVVSGLISGYKNPYSSTYTNPLASVEKPTLTNINTPFTKNTTSQDLVNLFNSAGTDYAGGANPLTKGSSLGSGLIKLLQPETNADGTQVAKPGVPNVTDTTVPRSTAPVTALPTTTPGLLTGQTIKTKEQADIEKALATEKLRLEQEKLAKENAEKLKLNSAWYKAGYASADDYSKGMALGYNSGDDYYNYLKNLTLIPKTDTLPGGIKTNTLPGGTVAGNAGIDTLSGSTVGGPAVNPRTGKPNYTVRNPTGFTANDLQLMEAMGWTPEQLKANNEQFAIERAKEADAYASSQRISNIIDSWKTPEDRWKWFAENPNDPYTLMAKEDITLPANYMTPPAVTPPAVTPPVVTNTSGVNPGTPAEIEARRIATDKLIAEQQAAAQAAAFKTAQDKTNAINQAAINQQITNDQQKVNESRDYLKSQNFEMSVFDANPNSQYRPVNTNAGIVTPSINNVVSKENLNTNVKGTNGESSIVDLLKTPTSQPIITASPTGPYYNEQDQARYQAAALATQQGVPITGVSSLPSNSGITSLVGPQQPAVTQYTDMNYITPAMRQQITADPTILQRRPDLQGAMDWSATQDARRLPELTSGQLAQ